MVSICYEDNAPRSQRPVRYWDIRATSSWLRHYENSLLLSFLATHETDPAQRARANHELGVARRKMDYMERHGNFDADEARRGAERLKRRWAR